MRVIAGTWRGRPLSAPRGADTRPTSDRVREAIFSILGNVSDLQVLDAYAGTGALGIEALSRGACEATFVESSRRTAAVLERNLASLDAGERARVLVLPFERALRVLAGQKAAYGLALFDPPYALVRADRVRALLEEAAGAGLFGPLAAGARVVLEHAARDPAPEVTGLSLEATRRYGDTAVSFYLR